MKNILLIIFIVVIQSCSDGSKLKRTDVISSDDMVTILTQRQLIVSELNTFQYQGFFKISCRFINVRLLHFFRLF